VSARPLLTLRIAAAVTALSATAIVIQLAAREREPPVRCPPGLALSGGRCCGWGQSRVAGRCEGYPLGCGPGQESITLENDKTHCVLAQKRFAVAGGKLPPGAADWALREPNAPVNVPSFVMDRAEVTVHRYQECVAAEKCDPLPAPRDPGLPVSGVSPSRAEAFCRFAGGRLPTSAEWRLAASGTEGRRFPWGHTGLVCRRAAFGLVAGPCSTEGLGPELAGSRPAGATPAGLLDLSGNVAEWTRDPDGRYRARGGSYRSRVAVELMAAAVESVPQDAEHVGFRCVY
jgi:formylglycine-generating enzyme required for sulfatase activity